MARPQHTGGIPTLPVSVPLLAVQLVLGLDVGFHRKRARRRHRHFWRPAGKAA